MLPTQEHPLVQGQGSARQHPEARRGLRGDLRARARGVGLDIHDIGTSFAYPLFASLCIDDITCRDGVAPLSSCLFYGTAVRSAPTTRTEPFLDPFAPPPLELNRSSILLLLFTILVFRAAQARLTKAAAEQNIAGMLLESKRVARSRGKHDFGVLDKY